MKNKRLLQALSGVALVLALAALVLFHSGCSKLFPTAPGATDRVDDLWSGSPDSDTLPSEWTELCSVENADWFGPVGGVVTQNVNHNLLQFRVPPQALQDSVRITVKTTLLGRLSGQKEQYRLEFEFTPDGLIFLKPAHLIFQSKLIGGEKGDFLVLYWLNPLTSVWEVQETVKVKDTVTLVQFDVYHFSRYAIGQSSLPPRDK